MAENLKFNSSAPAIPLFLLTLAFFDRWTALLAAAFWAFGINAITHNRIGKEDSLLVFFMLFAFFFFVRAKQLPPVDKSGRARPYAASAVSFGLMIASKYFPHYRGLNMLFHHNFHVREARPNEPGGTTPGWFFIAIVGVFLLASPAVLMPGVWQYMNAYMGERLLTHSGYLFAGELYKNNMSSSPFWGTPIYFYLLFLAIKVPIVTLIAFLVGLVLAISRPRHVGHGFLLFMFLFWLVPYSLIGGKWLRYTLSVMPFVYMLAAVGVVGRASLSFRLWPHRSELSSHRSKGLRCDYSAGSGLRYRATRPHLLRKPRGTGRRAREVSKNTRSKYWRRQRC